MRGRVGRSRGISHRLDLVHVLGVSVVDLLAHLFGQGEVDGLAGRGSQLGDALLLQLDVVHDLGDGDALLLSEVLARDPDEVNGLLDALLNGLGEGNLDILDVLSDDGDVVASLLGNLLAVVVAVLVVSIAGGVCWQRVTIWVLHSLAKGTVTVLAVVATTFWL